MNALAFIKHELLPEITCNSTIIDFKGKIQKFKKFVDLRRLNPQNHENPANVQLLKGGTSGCIRLGSIEPKLKSSFERLFEQYIFMIYAPETKRFKAGKQSEKQRQFCLRKWHLFCKYRFLSALQLLKATRKWDVLLF